jgi:hypothetical protein
MIDKELIKLLIKMFLVTLFGLSTVGWLIWMALN